MIDQFDRLKSALADRYPIERPLGAGGMATVYLARDLKHNRQVAVKVLRPELTESIGAERFLREIEIAARLTHPHILPLHDSGEADGFLYYVMPHIEGESLRGRLTKEPQLSVVDALRVTKEVADALSYAHSHNVVHRDIKPENILMQAGHALVADFGIARAMSLSTVGRLTATGVAIGTPAYMSPEQINGEPHLDNRSDIYSLGCVLYETLAGQPPFTGPTVESICRQHVSADLPSVTTIRPLVPDGVVAIINATLAKTPADRYASADALAEDLNLQLALATDPSRAISPVKPLARRWPMVGTLAVVGALALLVAAFGWLRTESRSNPRVVSTQQQVTFVGNVVRASISPQGDFLAYTTKGADGMTLMVHDLESGSAIEIASSPRIDFPVWSSDGRQILVESGPPDASAHKVYPRLGGEPYPLPIVGGIARWSADGRQVFSWSTDSPDIYVYTIAADSVTRIRAADTSAWLHEVAQHPRGDALAVLHVQRSGSGSSIWRLAIDPGQGLAGLPQDSAGRLIVQQSEVLIEDDAQLLSVEWSRATDALYYLREDQSTHQLWKLRTKPNGAALGVAPELLLSGLDVPTQTSRIGLSILSLTDDGSQLFFVKGRPFWNLWAMRPSGDGWVVQPFTSGTATNIAPHASPDGEWVAYNSREGGRTNVFIAPSNGGTPRQLTHLDSVTGYPVWSPDGESIAFGVRRNGRNVVATVAVNPATVKVFDATELSGNGTITWAPGLDILYQRPELRNFHFLNPDTGEERPLLSADSAAVGFSLQAHYSPDRTRLALLRNRRGDLAGIYVLSLVDGTQKRLNTQPYVSPMGWSPDGQTIYALSQDRWGVLAVPVDGDSPTLLHTLPFAASWVATTYQGHWFVFSAPGATGDVWRIENFDVER